MILMDNILLAAYGTLRKGYSNSILVDKKDNYLGKGITVEKYQMRASGIPFVNKKPDNNIVVDIWEITPEMLPRVDMLEGYDPNDHEGSWYKRELIDIELNNKIVKAWLYFNDTTRGQIVESGDYSDYRKI